MFFEPNYFTFTKFMRSTDSNILLKLVAAVISIGYIVDRAALSDKDEDPILAVCLIDVCVRDTSVPIEDNMDIDCLLTFREMINSIEDKVVTVGSDVIVLSFSSFSFLKDTSVNEKFLTSYLSACKF